MLTILNPNMIRLQWAMLLLVYMVTPTIWAAPRALFTTFVNPGGPPYSVSLNAITSSPWEGNKAITDLQWSTSENGNIIQNIITATSFATAGTYSITLTVWDAAGKFDTLTKSITVGNVQPSVDPTPVTSPVTQPSNNFSSPTPRFDIVRTDGLTVYVNASASIPGGNNKARITNYEYYATLGTKTSGPYTATSPQTSFTLDEAGRYQITLRVTDSNGNPSTTPAQRPVDVQSAQSKTPVTGTLIADFSIGTIVGCRVSVNASASTPTSQITRYEYSWRQSSSTKSDNFTRYSDYADITLPQPGNYTFSLQVFDDDGNSSTNTSTQNVTIDDSCTSTNVTTQPGIETLYGGDSVNESTKLVFDTNGGNKFFTIRNTGDAALRLTNPRFTSSSGLFKFDDSVFSSEKILQSGSELQFSITLIGASSGEDVFAFDTNVEGKSTIRLNLTSTVTGTVVSPPTGNGSAQPDVNQGSSDNNLIYGDPNTTVSNDDFKIMVTASVGSEIDAFKALTLEEILEDGFVVENDSSVDINATIVPSPEHEDVHIVIVVGWDDQEETTDWGKVKWYYKVLPKNMHDDTGWVSFVPSLSDLSKLYIRQYIKARFGEQSHFVNVFTGQLLPPEIEGFGTARRVHFVVGYTPNNVIYLLSQPITLKVPVPLTPKYVEIKLNESKTIEIQIGSKGTIDFCKVSDETIAEVFSQGNFSCGVTGLKVGTTTLTVTGVEPDSTSITTITVVE